MFVIFLTLSLCLSKTSAYGTFDEISTISNYSNEPIYNIHDWVTNLHLQRCAFVAVGLKLFSIFVEDEIVDKNGTVEHRKYFLGMCDQSTLEEWNFCSENLMKKRKHKCKFILRDGKYHPRVHRRFCDLSIMVNNKDCLCENTILEDEMYKVKGFPTCYIPPLPNSLCKYNVCGLSQCSATTVESRIHTVECNADCKGKKPFCEYPMDRTSRVPVVRSFWSKWRLDGYSESLESTRKKRYVATCINKYTGERALDCLGPGTGCCPEDTTNCTCQTYEECGGLKLRKIIYETHKSENRLEKFYLPHQSSKSKRNWRYIRAPDPDEDIEDDEDENEDLDEDIVFEENTDDELPASTTEELEKEEVAKKLKSEVLKDINRTDIIADSGSLENLSSSRKLQSNYFVLNFLIVCYCPMVLYFHV